jgi:hypothetical protein
MVNVDSVIICIIEEPLLETKRAKLSELISVGVVIFHATIDNSRDNESEVENMKKELEFLRFQVNCYKGSQETMTKFVGGFLEEDEKHVHIKREFLVKIEELQKKTLQLSVVHKEVLNWNEKQVKVHNQVEYIKEIQKACREEDRGIKIPIEESIARMQRIE